MVRYPTHMAGMALLPRHRIRCRFSHVVWLHTWFHTDVPYRKSQILVGSGTMITTAAPAPAHEIATRAPDIKEPGTMDAAQVAAAPAKACKPVAAFWPAAVLLLRRAAGGRIRARARNHAAAPAAGDQIDPAK